MELVDALGSGSSGGNAVGVRVPPSAPSYSIPNLWSSFSVHYSVPLNSQFSCPHSSSFQRSSERVDATLARTYIENPEFLQIYTVCYRLSFPEVRPGRTRCEVLFNDFEVIAAHIVVKDFVNDILWHAGRLYPFFSKPLFPRA